MNKSRNVSPIPVATIVGLLTASLVTLIGVAVQLPPEIVLLRAVVAAVTVFCGVSLVIKLLGLLLG